MEKDGGATTFPLCFHCQRKMVTAVSCARGPSHTVLIPSHFLECPNVTENVRDRYKTVQKNIDTSVDGPKYKKGKRDCPELAFEGRSSGYQNNDIKQLVDEGKRLLLRLASLYHSNRDNGDEFSNVQLALMEILSEIEVKAAWPGRTSLQQHSPLQAQHQSQSGQQFGGSNGKDFIQQFDSSTELEAQYQRLTGGTAVQAQHISQFGQNCGQGLGQGFDGGIAQGLGQQSGMGIGQPHPLSPYGGIPRQQHPQSQYYEQFLQQSRHGENFLPHSMLDQAGGLQQPQQQQYSMMQPEGSQQTQQPSLQQSTMGQLGGYQEQPEHFTIDQFQELLPQQSTMQPEGSQQPHEHSLQQSMMGQLGGYQEQPEQHFRIDQLQQSQEQPPQPEYMVNASAYFGLSGLPGTQVYWWRHMQ